MADTAEPAMASALQTMLMQPPDNQGPCQAIIQRYGLQSTLRRYDVELLRPLEGIHTD